MDRTRSSNADRTLVDLESNPPALLRVDEGCPTRRGNMTGDQMQEIEVSCTSNRTMSCQNKRLIS